MLEVRMLGQFDVRRDGQPVEIPSRPAQSLLAYLLLNAGAAHRREKLAGLLWPEANESNARSNLRHAVWRLRRAIEPEGASRCLVVDNFSVSFDADADYWLDVRVLEQAGGSVADLQAAVGVYRGELLPGFYAEWIELERERLQTVFERQMQALLDRLSAAQRWPDVLEWAERWISLGQAPEPAYRALMLAHSHLGDLGSVGAAFMRCRDALQRDLGVEPSEQTRSLYERLRRPAPAGAAAEPEPGPPAAAASTPAPARPRAGGLPAPTTPFVGREQELAEVAQRLSSDTCRLLTLTGPGGIGKTRLGLQAAQNCQLAGQDLFPDGVFFVSLSAVSATEYLVPAIAEALQFSFYGGDDATAQLIGYLHDKRMLLVLDNFEHLLEGAAFIAEVLRSAPGVKFLVTSQERLNLQGEWLLEVDGMPYPEADSADPADYAAVQLFVQSARRVDSGFRLSEADKPAVLRICRFVAGMPLGIELAAAWVRAISCAEIAGEIERNLGFLTTTLRDVPERHRSLIAVFDHSWQRLSDEERAAFRRLSVFWGGFQREAAEQVAGANLALLSALVDKSLLRRSAAGRYGMHGLLRKYGQMKLNESGEAPEVRRRHLDYFAGVAEAAEPGLRRAEQLAWLAQLETEHDNMRAAMKWALTSEDYAAGQRLAGNLARFWYLRGYWAEGREWLARMLDHRTEEEGAAGSDAEACDPACLKRAQARALMGAGWLADENGDEGAFYSESLALCREVGDDWGAAYSLRGLGVKAYNEGEYAEADHHLHEALSLFERLGDEWGMGLVKYNLAWHTYGEDYIERSRQLWDEALAHFRRVGDRWGIAVSLTSLSYLARLGDDYAKAAALSEESLALFRELGDKAGIGTSLIRLGQISFRRSNYPQAIALLKEGRAVQTEIGDMRGLINSDVLLGLIALYQGHFDGARRLLENARTLSLQLWGEGAATFVEAYQALLAFCQGDLDTAWTMWEAILGETREEQAWDRVAFCLLGMGMVAYQRGDYDASANLLEESLGHFRTGGDRRYVATVLNALGRATHGQGDVARAMNLLKDALVTRKEIGDRQGLAESLEALAALNAQTAPEHAVRLLGAASGLRAATGAPLPPVERAAHTRLVAELRGRLAEAPDGEAEFEDLWETGELLGTSHAERLLELAWAQEH